MKVMKQLKKALKNPKETYASWVLTKRHDPNPPGTLGSDIGVYEVMTLDFREFERMYETWNLALKSPTENQKLIGQVRAISRRDGSVVASVVISDPNQADCYHTELQGEGYLAERVAHLLKMHPEPFKAMRQDRKRFELRKDDRAMGFGIDDELRLAQWDPHLKRYLGDVIVARVTYITRNEEWGLKPEHVVLGLMLQEYLPPLNPRAQLWLSYEANNLN